MTFPRKPLAVVSSICVLLILSGCGGGDSAGPDPAVATTITANSSTTLTAVAGAAVGEAPSVLVRDQRGAPMSGVAVGFAITGGGGSVAQGSAATNAAGIATAGSWTLGAAAGSNTLVASTGTLTAVTFTATATAGAAAVIAKTAGDAQSATTGSAVAVAPSVTVRDANGNPVSGVSVIFSVGAGGGIVTGGTQTTNASGAATVGTWTLGPSAGANTLIASAGALAPVTFTATGTVSVACTTATPYAFGSVANGTLSTSDCRLSDGSFIDFYTTSVPTAGGYLFSQTAVFDALLILYHTTGVPIGVNDDFGLTTNPTIKALLPSGNYALGASSFDPSVTGDYTISSTTTTSSINNCEEVFIVQGVSSVQTLQTSDCVIGAFNSDDIYIALSAGQTITVSMSSTVFDTYLEIYDSSGLVKDNNNRDASTTDAQIVFTAPTSGFYLIAPTSAIAGATGAYTLIIQ